MKQTEIVACIYKHIGRTDDLESLTELAEEIARIAAEEEREACASALERIGESPAGEYLIGKDLADLCAAAIRSRSNAVLRGEPLAASPLENTVAELIARQAKQLKELRDEVADLRERSRRARSHIYCIGGPFNDNKLGYSKPQMVTFARIADELGDV